MKDNGVDVLSFEEFEDTVDNNACKTGHKFQRYTARTAGILAYVRPCQIVIDATEELLRETPTRMALYIYDIFTRAHVTPDQLPKLFVC